MAEIPDSEFLRILRESPIVPEAEVQSARARQRDELETQGSCRSLFAILLDKGLIDERVARNVKPTRDVPDDVTPHDPTVVLPPHDETPRTSSTSSLSKVRSARRRPPEVELAMEDPRNHLGPYILVREVGKGGMGRVYLAWDENVGRSVAVKVIDTEDATDRERFVREAQIAGRLHHSAIATVYQAGEDGSRGYIAMQFIEGGPIDAEKRSLLETLGLIRDAAHALRYAHEQGVIHRDVKPGNLMVDQMGRVFLTDFGLAKEIIGNPSSQLSVTGTTFGTPQFMSPEQARGEHRKIDARSDVYSLGATLYALVAHRPPFSSPNVAGLLIDVLETIPAPLSKHNPDISPEFEMLVSRAMAKEPSRRFRSMAEFSDALDRMVREGRYEGRYGLMKSMAIKWLPRVAIAVALAIGVRVAIPMLTAAPAPVDDSAFRLAAATAALRTLETQKLAPEERAKRIDREVLRRVDDGALKVRALHLRGDRAGAERELKALEGRDDYRLPMTAALFAVEDALAAPPPLPALEAPGPEWEEPVAPWPEAMVTALRAAASAKVEPELSSEYAKDSASIQGLLALAESQWGKAADLLAESRARVLPVYAAAWARAAYLDRRFADVKELPGAQLALAAGSATELARIGAHAALARLEGVEPVEPHVAIAMPGSKPERRAALESARQRELARRGRDEKAASRRALEELGPSPKSWEGRLAAVELRLLLGELEEAARLADGLVRQAPTWAPPRLLRAQVRIKQGRLEEARADLTGLKGIRASQASAAVELASAERTRKSGGSPVEEAKAALREARGAADTIEGLTLTGAASIVLAQDAASSGRDEGEWVTAAVDALGRALARSPEDAEARFHRGRALFLQSEGERRAGRDGKAPLEEALRDEDAALAAMPGLRAARYMRGIVNFSLGREADAVADWRLLIASDASWDTPDVRAWIQLAETRLKK